VAAGYEPRRLYNVVEFMMNDKDDSGTVSAEEAMQILYMRFGRTLLDSVRVVSLNLPLLLISHVFVQLSYR
jgi:hypothetical protein